MTINASELVNLGPKKLAEVLGTLRRREKLVADQRSANVTVSRLGRAIAQLDAKVGHVVAGDVGARPLATVELPPKKAGQPKKSLKASVKRPPRSKPDLKKLMVGVLSKQPRGLDARQLAEAVVAAGYPGRAAAIAGVVGRVATMNRELFIVAAGGKIRLPGGALKIDVKSKPAKKVKAEGTAAAMKQPRLSDLVVEELRKAAGPLHAKQLAERITARGYKSRQTDRPFAHAIQAMLAQQVKRGLLRKAAPATFALGKKAEPVAV